jgi:hypothetical protein
MKKEQKEGLFFFGGVDGFWLDQSINIDPIKIFFFMFTYIYIYIILWFF